MLGTQHTSLVLVRQITGRARTTGDPAPPFPLQGPACNQAGQHIKQEETCTYTDPASAARITTRLHSEPDPQATQHHGGWSFTALCPSAPLGQVGTSLILQMKKLKLREIDLLTKVTQ